VPEHGYFHGIQTTTIPADTTFTSAVNIQGCNMIGLELQTFSVFLSTTTANVYLVVCRTIDGTFRRLTCQGVYSGSSGIYNWELPSSTGNMIVNVPQLAGYNYAKVEFSNTCTALATISVHKINR
jgi:hypothetical protein